MADLALWPDPEVSEDARIAQLESDRALRSRLPINAKDHGAVGDGVADDTTALQTALAAARAAGRRLYIPAGSYLVTGQLGTGSSPIDVYGDGAATKLLHQIPADSMFEAIGSEGALVDVTAPAAAGATVLTVTSTAGIAAGDLIVIQDSSQPIKGNSNNTTAAIMGEIASVRSVDSGTQLTVRRKLEVAYTAAAKFKKLNAVNGVRLADFTIVNPTPGTMPITCRALEATFVRDVSIANVRFQDLDATAIQLFRCVDLRVTACRFLNMRDQESGNTPYDIIATRGTQHGVISGCRGMYGRHMFTTGNSAADPASSNILIADCIATEYSQAAFDTHPGSRRITFADCQVHGGQSSGFQIRGPDCVVSNPIVSGATKGVFLVYGADRALIHGGRLDGCDIGIEVDSSSGVSASDVSITAPRTNAVKVVRDADFPTLTDLSLRDIDVAGNPTGDAFFFDHWDDTFRLRGLHSPDATNKITVGPTIPKIYGFHNDGFNGGIAPSGAYIANNTLALTANGLFLARFVPERNMTIDKLAFAVTTASGADDAFDIGIYSMAAAAATLTRLVSSGAVTGASGSVTGGGLNSTGRKVVAINPTKLVAGTVYYIGISCAAVGATISAAGFGSSTPNQIMGTDVPAYVAATKAASHPLPSSVGGPNSTANGPKVGVLAA